ncbi:ly6/PLAUR domain-containing protein 1-like [Acanthaster planci]|uniref:Ly6/PLAUR domain-containing protein 1-like n=1 Tax=Acanthaster planci TaxID=133434 RepID=A0A8B7Y4A2_ACAPL|nr:ly6/PLAUR domain-containing protein 1-like [Acanthaster planci]
MKVFVVAILMTCIGGIMGLQCYTCASTTSEACADPFNAEGSGVLTLNCTSGQDVCQKSSSMASGLSVVSRSCASQSLCQDASGCQTTSAGGASVTNCCCGDNLCNGAGSLAASAFATVAVIVAAAVFSL